MTNVPIDAADFAALLGRDLPRSELEERLPMMGLTFEGWDGETFAVDAFANRPDWYSAEGLARSFQAFLGINAGPRRYTVAPARHEFRIEPGVERVRPFAVGAFVRDVRLDDRSLRSLIGLQERLHTTVGRRRAKVAIGIHDADRVEPPFAYRAVAPGAVRFVPLGLEVPLTLEEILREHEKGREYAATLAGADVFPVIQDARGEVLSFPPIINGVVTRLTAETKSLFLDVTGTDAETVRTVLHILAAALADRGATLEAVNLSTPQGRTVTPDLSPRAYALDLGYAGGLLGVDLSTKEAIGALTRMGHEVTAKGGSLTVLVPAYRADILHVVDLVEDVAVGFGYERLPLRLPSQATVGSAAPSEQLAATVRSLLVGHGYQEIVALPLTPREEPVMSAPRVALRNPMSEETVFLRSALLPGLLRLLEVNRQRDLPQRVFEIGAVASPRGNRLHVAAAAVQAKAGFTEAKSLAQALLRDLGREAGLGPAEDPNYLPGRCMAVSLGAVEVGRFGEIHPRVLDAHQLRYPVIALELELSASGGTFITATPVSPGAEVAKPG